MQFIINKEKKEKTQQIQPTEKLKILKLGGSASATKNLTVYEYGNDIIAVDCGIGFPDADMPGVDVVIPDFTYLLQNQDKIRGLIITHGHEDHFGSVPFLLKEINIPIYSSKLVEGYVRERLQDRGTKQLEQNAKFINISPKSQEINLGNFKISAFNVNHSVPHSLGIIIKTPIGNIVHMADFKVDFAPVIDKPIDLGTLARISDEGILCLLSDCLGADHPGFTKPEKSLDQTFPDLFLRAEGRQILITTISSNISRMEQIFRAAVEVGRKVVVMGRSMNQGIKVAQEAGMLQFSQDLFIPVEKSSEFPQKDLVYLVAGCYGQPGSALERISRHDDKKVRLEENAMVIFSADPNPPGADIMVQKVQDNMILLGAEIIYSGIQDSLHVSGHGTKGDLSLVASIAKPKYFIPIGGEPTKMRAYKHMVRDLGFEEESVFELLEGDCVIFDGLQAKLGEPIETKQVYVDGSLGSPVGEIVIKDREQLATDGIFVVVVPISKETKTALGKTEIITRGFVYVKESKDLMGRTKDKINKIIDKHSQQGNWNELQEDIEKDVGHFLYKETGRSPMVIVHAIYV